MTSETITVPGSTALNNTHAPSQLLYISPNEGYTMSASNVTPGSNPTGITSITKADTTSAGATDNKVLITVDIDNAHTVSGNSIINLDITAAATAITDYGLVRPAIIENAEHALIDTEVTMVGNSGVSVLTEKSNVNNVDTHYFNSEVPFNTWTKIGTVTVDADNDYTIVYPPYLVSNGSEEGLSKFDLIQTSVSEPVDGIIAQYEFDLMFKDTGATGFVWPSGWLASAITDPEMSAVLSVKTILVDVPEYDYVVDGVDLGGGTEDVTSGSDIIPSGGVGTYDDTEYSDEPFDIVFSGSDGAEVTIEVTEVSGDTDVTTEATGNNSSTVYTMSDLGFVNIPLGFEPSTTTKEFDVTISGVNTTAILSQVEKTSTGAHTPYSGASTSSATNRYIQLGSTDVNVDIISTGFDTETSNDHTTKTAGPLSSISGREVGFTIIREDSNSNNKAKITGDIFYERMGYKTKTFTLDFEDWFDYDENNKNFTVKPTLPSSVLDTTNTVGAVVTIKNLTPTVVNSQS